MKKRIRPGARILLLTPDERFLLLHFVYASGPLGGTDYWGIPGGGIDGNETPQEGAVRELYEETGLETDVASLGDVRDVSTYEFRLMSGEEVMQKDYLFLLRVPGEFELSREHFTPEEKTTMAEARWWSVEELRRTKEVVMPHNLLTLVEGLLANEKP